MLPCKSKCSNYFEGCHKSCMRWNLISKANQMDLKRKKEYLLYHNERCAQVVRQCYQMVPHLTYR